MILEKFSVLYVEKQEKDPEAHFCSSFHPLYQLLFMWCFSLKLSLLMISPAPSICSSISFLPFWSKSFMTSVCQVLGDTSLLSAGSGVLAPPHQSTSSHWFLWPHFLPWPPPFLLCSTSEVGVPLGSGLSFVLVYQSVFTQLQDSWWSEASAIRIFLISVLLGLYMQVVNSGFFQMLIIQIPWRKGDFTVHTLPALRDCSVPVVFFPLLWCGRGCGFPQE